MALNSSNANGNKKLTAAEVAKWPDAKLKSLRDDPQQPYKVRTAAGKLLDARTLDTIRAGYSGR